jgi:asparagine synthase (glutamine-hydrolysing)
MCGIAGVLTASSGPSAAPAVGNALKRLAHRGPDADGLSEFAVADASVVLGHRRLSIIDLSEAGKQPRLSADGRYAVTFNGELYNYIELRKELEALGRRFASRTDTEVLLQAWEQWGEAALSRFDGMFAFAIFDKKDRTITLVRDSFGIKPVFYHATAKSFGFASELPALLELVEGSIGLNWQRIHGFLCWGEYDDDDQTFYAEIRQLRPGHLLRVSLGLPPDVRRWWWPDIAATSKLSFNDAADRLRGLFLESVKRQLRSDVPVGAALSGGLDSSAIVCAMRHLEPDMPIHTFSYVATGSALNERHWSQRIVDHVGAQAHWIDGGEGELSAVLDDVVRAQGEPFGSTSVAASYLVFQRIKQTGITVALEGQGADEALAGYDGYPTSLFRGFAEEHRYLELGKFALAWSRWPNRGMKMAGLHLGDMVQSKALRGALLRSAGHGMVPDWLNETAFRDTGATPQPLEALPIEPEGRGRRLAERMRLALTKNRLPALLRHGDRNSMRWSVESRVPFLAPQLAEFTLTLPQSYLVSPEGETKHIFRKAMQGIVPDEVLQRRDKIGYETPERAVLNHDRGRIAEWMEIASEIDVFHGGQLRRRVSQVLDGSGPVSFQAWRIINLCRWLALQPSKVAVRRP